jgi:hypothetical protein
MTTFIICCLVPAVILGCFVLIGVGAQAIKS